MEVHFIAIGGSVMHQLAISLRKKGYTVTGSDDEIFEPACTNLAKEGLLPSRIGWDPSKIHKEIDAVILGMHAKSDNPELEKAKSLGLPIYSFPEYIFEECRNKTRIVVGGSHGKTSTTAMIMHVLKGTGKKFDYLVGARLDGFPQSVSISDAPLIVCEGDEYPASVIEKRPKFHFLFPHIAILTGIAWDHINVFPTFENYLEQFRIFIDKIEKEGILIYNETDPVLADLIADISREDIRLQPYGLPGHTIENGKTIVAIEGNTTELMVFGNHNLLNLHAAFYACKEAGVTATQFIKAIGNFRGAAKRLEIIASSNDMTIFRDFAHAPSKLKATIEAVKKQFANRNLIGVFELHTFSSLNEKFLSEYAGSMEDADEAAVFYSKHALSLKRLPDLDPEKIIKGFNKKGLAVFNRKEDLEAWLKTRTYRNANLLLMSSGNYDDMDIDGLVETITKTGRKADE